MWSVPAKAAELVIGEEKVFPGIVFIFEAAAKDAIWPQGHSLPEDLTHIHIEARVNWGESDLPEGTPAGGFVPGLNITAFVQNQRTSRAILVDLKTHINLVDNFHYARNISLPGAITDRYTVIFFIKPPYDLALHQDWVDDYGPELMEEMAFRYENLDFEEMSKIQR